MATVNTARGRALYLLELLTCDLLHLTGDGPPEKLCAFEPSHGSFFSELFAMGPVQSS